MPLLKRWNDWSAGIGYHVDDGRTPGMYYAAGLLGARGELRPAPLFNTVSMSIYRVGMRAHLGGGVNWSTAALTLNAASGSTVAVSGSVSTDTANGTSLTYSHTVPSGSNRAIIVTASVDGAASPTGVTFDGDALTLVAEGLGNPRASLWRRVAPTETTGDVVVSIAGGTDIVSSAQAYTGVDQSTPEDDTSATFASSTSGPVSHDLDAGDGGMAIDAITADNTSSIFETDILQTELLNDTQGAITGGASYKAISNSEFQFQYLFEALTNQDPDWAYLYAVGGLRGIIGGTVYKISIQNSAFPSLETGSHSLSTQHIVGQPAFYEGHWYFPMGNDNRARKLSVVARGAVGVDTLDGTATPFVPGADHLALLNDQLVGHVKEGISAGVGLGGVGAQDGGVRILKVDGTPATAGDWGSPFPVGAITKRAAGLLTLGGATFVLNSDGLFSFNSKGRSGIVFNDVRAYQGGFENIEMATWKGGIVIPQPTELKFWSPGELPLSIGLETKPKDTTNLPNAQVTELHGGRMLSVAVFGNQLYGIYQPDPSTSNAMIVHTQSVGKPSDLSWQCLGTVTLADAQYMANCHVAIAGRPLDNARTTPTLWFGDNSDLAYITLDITGTPQRARTDTHKVTTSADAYMSELVFDIPHQLDEIVVHTSSDMISGDEVQISLIADGTGLDSSVGTPIRGSGVRHVRTVNRRNVSHLILHVSWAATSSADRVPPVIKMIELYGKPETPRENR